MSKVNTPMNATYLDSGALKNTHQFIAIQAVNILSEDLHKISKDKAIKENFELLKEKFLEDLKEGSIAPDYGTVGRKVHKDAMAYSLFQDHFFDPDTEKNFTHSKLYPSFEVPDNAESQARIFFSRAVRTYLDGDKANGIYLLGKAVHYFSDANQPHHVGNILGGPGTSHTRLETYAETVKQKYAVKSMKDLHLYEEFSGCDFIDFISKMTFKHAHLVKPLAIKATLQNTWKEWDEVIEIALGYAQQGVAVILYRFLQEITHQANIEVKEIGKFHAVISVGDAKYAGTNNDVHFGVVAKDGKVIEFKCDLPGDDFEAGTTYGYQFAINQIKFDDIKEFFIKKYSNNLIDDQMQLDEVEVYMHGKRVAHQKPNTWIKKENNIFTFKCDK